MVLLQVLYKHKIIVFGGFYDTLREVRFVDGSLSILLKISSLLLMDWC
jgi:hypothetical protein